MLTMGSSSLDTYDWNPVSKPSAVDPYPWIPNHIIWVPIGIWAPWEALREAPVGDIWEAPGKHLGRYLGGDRGRPGTTLESGGWEGADLEARALN